MKITEQRLLLIAPVSFRMDWLISRAWRPTWESPISPSNSFCGTSAATESMTTTSTALDLISISVMCMASSPLEGWLTSRVSRSTPSFLAQLGSRACSASMKAAMPPFFWAWAMTCRAKVVLPLDSGPKISTTRPRGMPWPPSARSKERLPVEMPSMGPVLPSPKGMIAPSPNCFSIWATVFFSVGWFSSIAMERSWAGSPPSDLLSAGLPRCGAFLAISRMFLVFPGLIIGRSSQLEGWGRRRP